MKNQNALSRRTVMRSSVLGLLAVSSSNILYSRARGLGPADDKITDGKIFHRYPSVDDEIVAEVVGASHFNFDRVQELVNNRPELARATWDWAFGDWETALGAASHVGRRDIAEFLMAHGARPDIFTFAMFGRYTVVTAMIDSTPGVESIGGPHGISLLSHAKAGLRSDYGVALTERQIQDSNNLIDYLEKLGTADKKEVNITLTEEEKTKYLGDYKYGEGPDEGLSVKINMRNMLALGKLGYTGGSLYQKASNVFTYNGTTSVQVTFQLEDDQVVALTITEPDLTLKATKIN